MRYSSDLGVNDASDNPEVISVNISSTAGNQATVWFRFRYEGGWDYAWMLDDIEIVAPTSFELELTESNYHENYKYTPINQLSSFSFDGTVQNNGGSDQLTHLNVIVKDQQNNIVFNELSPDSILVPYESKYFEVNNTFTPNSIGLYSFAVEAHHLILSQIQFMIIR